MFGELLELYDHIYNVIALQVRVYILQTRNLSIITMSSKVKDSAVAIRVKKNAREAKPKGTKILDQRISVPFGLL